MIFINLRIVIQERRWKYEKKKWNSFQYMQKY